VAVVVVVVLVVLMVLLVVLEVVQDIKGRVVQETLHRLHPHKDLLVVMEELLVLLVEVEVALVALVVTIDHLTAVVMVVLVDKFHLHSVIQNLHLDLTVVV
jgi:hypothetical protein